MRSTFALSLAAIAVLASGASPVVAQRTADAELRGDVVSSDTGEPIAGAWIALEGRGYGTYSRRDGSFRLPEVPDALFRYDVAALGYLPLIVTLEPGPEDLVIGLAPDESLLPGVRFVLRHLEDRRNAARFFDRQALAFSGSFDLRELLATRGVRGVRRFCLDERWVPGVEGAPPADFYLMEIHGGTVRLYTEEFLEEMAAKDSDTVRRIIRLQQPTC